MRRNRRMLASGIAFALAFSSCVPVAAYADTQSDLSSAQSKLDSLGSELSSLQSQLAQDTSNLEDTAYQIGENQSKIDETQQQLASAQSVLSSRMRSNYKTGDSTLLQVVLGSSNLDDLVSRVYYMDKISSEDEQTITQVKDLKQQLDDEQDALQQQKDEQQQAVDQAQSEVDSYQSKVAEAQSYYNSLDSKLQQEIAASQASNANVSTAVASISTATASSTATQETTADNSQTTNNSGNSGSSSSNSGSGSSSSGSSTTAGAAGNGVSTAYSCIGCPYVWGATGPSSFDCSGLVCYCYGYALGRDTYSMISSLQSSGKWKTSMDQLSYGDLVFPSTGHVGIYIGGGQMIHAPHEGTTVCVASVYSFYGGGSYY